MKTVILAGPAEVEKRSALLKIKEKYLPALTHQIDLKTNGLEQLESLLLTKSLFEDGPRLIVVENASEKLDLKKLKGLLDDLVVFVAAHPRSDCLLLQSGRRVGSKVLLFEGEKELSAFPFLDSLLEGKKAAFIEMEKLLEEYGSMYVLSMIFYGLRRNILPLPPSAFMQRKIKTQKQRYQTGDWKQLYRSVLETEFGIKSGAVTEKVSLTKLVQIFIGNLRTAES